MKRHSSALAILTGLALSAGVAWGADPYALNQPLQGITVHPTNFPNATWDSPLGDCTPPTYIASCAEVNREIRENFTPRQIGMLFGASTSYPEYPAVNERLLEKYADFLHAIGVEFSSPMVTRPYAAHLRAHGRRLVQK